MTENSIPNIIQSSINLIESNIGEHLSDILNPQSSSSSMWRPCVDVIECSSTIMVYVTVPGIEAENIDIDFFNNYVTIKGERKMVMDGNYQFRKKEITYGKFDRKIMLPISVTNNESVSVTVKNGMLCIVINKEMEETNRFSVKPSGN